MVRGKKNVRRGARNGRTRGSRGRGRSDDPNYRASIRMSVRIQGSYSRQIGKYLEVFFHIYVATVLTRNEHYDDYDTCNI